MPKRGPSLARSESPSHETSPASGAPSVAPGGRLRGVDVARGVALLGMMSVHVLPELDISGRTTVAYLWFDGRASALFALLVGVSLALANGGERRKNLSRQALASSVLTRALLVALIGLILGSLNTPVSVILTNYGLLIAVGLCFMGLRPRTLLFVAAVWVVATPLLSQVLRTHLPVDRGFDPAFVDLAHPFGLLTRLVLTGQYPVLQWTAYLLVGLAVGRLPLRRVSTALALALSGLALAVVSWMVSSQLLVRGFATLGHAGPANLAGPGHTMEAVQLHGQEGVSPTTTWWWQAVMSPHTATPFDLGHTIGTALLVLGLALLLEGWLERTSSRWLVLVRGPFAIMAFAGSMTLTLYTLHVLALQLYPGDDLDMAGLDLLLLVQVSAALTVAVLWRANASRGPLEAFVTYATRRAASLATSGVKPRSDRTPQESGQIVNDSSQGVQSPGGSGATTMRTTEIKATLSAPGKSAAFMDEVD